MPIAGGGGLSGAAGPRRSGPRPQRVAVVVAIVALLVTICWAVIVRVGGSPEAEVLPGGCQSAGSSVVPSASGILLPSPITYDAVFTGDATGATDVATSLIGFLESHDGQRVALAPNGVYLVSSVVFTARDLTVDFRGARLVAAPPGGRAILRLTDASNVVLDGPSIVGTGYKWEATAGDPAENQDALQNEHGIHVDGGSQNLINRPVTRDTRGDGIYVGYDAGKTAPATGVVVVDPDIQRASRNGIAPVAGGVAVVGGSIARTGLFGIDFEPNDDVGAQSIEGVVTKVDIRNAADLPSASSHASAPYAIAAGGYSSANKRSIWVEDVTGDALRMTFRDTSKVVVCGNVSDQPTIADFSGAADITFGGNIRITQR